MRTATTTCLARAIGVVLAIVVGSTSSVARAAPAPEVETPAPEEPPADVEPEPAPEPAPEADAPQADAPQADAPAPEPEPEPTPEPETSKPVVTNPVEAPKRAPSPREIRSVPTRIAVGVGLSPEAPGTKKERALVEQLKRSISASTSPLPDVRHVSAGSGDPRTICRERRDDLVVMIGYLPDREDPVVLTHDCRLDRPLGIRSSAAAAETGLLGALWDEHDELVRQGVRERRTIRRLSPTARGVIIASVAVAVVGVAIGLLVANALRDERVVVTVSP